MLNQKLLKLSLITAGIFAFSVPAVATFAETSSSDSSTLIAQAQNRTRRIRFARGKTSATVNDSVVRGTRDIYLLGARAKQRMSISITSVEDNAVFDVVAPNGRVIESEVTSWEGSLPRNGDYRIVVGGTRGNATYTLDVSIR